MVLAHFGWGWVFNQPEVIKDALPFVGGQKRSKRSVDLNGRRIKLIPGELRDELLSRPDGMRGDFVVMADRLCAFDDGRDVYYGRWNMIRTASLANIGYWYWAMCLGLAVLADRRLPAFFGYHLEPYPTQGREASSLIEVIYNLFSPRMLVWLIMIMFLWLVIRRYRAISLLNRVEKVVKEMRLAKGSDLTDYYRLEVLMSSTIYERGIIVGLIGAIGFRAILTLLNT